MSGNEIRRLRTAAGIPQVALAKLTGVHRTTLCLAEAGHVELSEEQASCVRSALLEKIRERARIAEEALASAAVGAASL